MMNWCCRGGGEGAWGGTVSDVSVIAGLFCTQAHLLCVRCLIKELLKIVMILSSHQRGSL